MLVFNDTYHGENIITLIIWEVCLIEWIFQGHHLNEVFFLPLCNLVIDMEKSVKIFIDSNNESLFEDAIYK